MPCYDPRDNQTEKIVYTSGIDPLELSAANVKIRKLEAVICALMNELNKNSNGLKIIQLASKNSSLDINQFYQKHTMSDINRLNVMFGKLSIHEQDILKTLIKTDQI